MCCVANALNVVETETGGGESAVKARVTGSAVKGEGCGMRPSKQEKNSPIIKHNGSAGRVQTKRALLLYFVELKLNAVFSLKIVVSWSYYCCFFPEQGRDPAIQAGHEETATAGDAPERQDQRTSFAPPLSGKIHSPFLSFL